MGNDRVTGGATVLVTGAAGYIGGMLVRRLLADDSDVLVSGVDWCRMPHGSAGVDGVIGHPRFAFTRADVRDRDAMEPLVAGAEAIVHLAAIVGDPACSREPDLARGVNLDASRMLVELAARHGTRHVVFVSTCSNYGISDPGKLADEDDPLNPISLYAETKVAIEELLGNGAGVPATTLRLATVHGLAPRMRLDLTVNQFALEGWRDRRLSIYGEDHWRPYVHVDDVARAIRLVLARPDGAIGRTFNVGDSGENYTKRMMFDLLRHRIDDLDAEWVGTGPDRRSYRVRFDRIRDDLGFAVTRRVPDGLDEVIAEARRGAFEDAASPAYRN